MKRKSFLQAAVMLFTLIGLSLSTARAQEVQVTIIPRMDPMPPQVMSYISQPGVFFNVTLNNTSTEALNVFLTLEVEQMTNGELHVITPYYIQPMNPIVLAPNMPTPVTSVALQNQFRQLETTDVVLRGGQLSDFYGTGIVGLLPEGMYRAYIKVYKWEPGVKYPQLLSNPMSGQCTFNVCYHAQAPEITMPFYYDAMATQFSKVVTDTDLAEMSQKVIELKQNMAGLSGAALVKARKEYTAQSKQYISYQQAFQMQTKSSSLQACVVDNNAANFAWTAPILNCGGTPKQFFYDFEVFPMNVAMSYPEQAVKEGTLALSLKGLTTTSCILTPEQVMQIQRYSYTGLFVARVTAKPRSTDKSNIDYVAIENGGHSQLLVFRFKDTTIINTADEEENYVDPYENEEEEEEDVVVETTPAISEDFFKDETITTDYVIFPPKLTSPDIKIRGLLEENGKVELKWEEPEAKTLPTNPKSLNYTYDVKVYKRSSLQTVEQAMNGEPIIKKESLTALQYTVPWEDLKTKIKLNDNLVYAVTATCTNESSITVEEDRRNIYQQSYADLSDKSVGMADCYPEAANNVSNKELSLFTEKQIRDMKVSIGEFPLTITEATIINKDHYKGKGFVTWTPFGSLPFNINVEFDSILINKEGIVYGGQVKSCRVEDPALNTYIPYDIFDDCNMSAFLSGGSAEALGNKVDEYLQSNGTVAEYYKWAQSGAALLDNVLNGQVPVNLPVSLKKPLGENGIRLDSSPIDIQILSAVFSPTTASVSVIGLLTMPESNVISSGVAVFGAPQICIQPESFAPKGATIALLSDVTFRDPKTNYTFNLKAPSDFVALTDGCSMTFTDDGLEQMTFEAQMTVPGLMKADDKGNVIENEDPAITVKAYIKDWDNWIGTLAMDNFQVEEASGFTFMVGGSGISYDHSISKKLSASFDLPKDDGAVKYNKAEAGVTGGVETWQGLYVDKLAVLLPSFFDDEKGGSVEIGVRGLYYDDSGVSLTAAVQGSQSAPIVKAHTSKAGGWGISLESVNLNVISSQFASTSIIGGIQAPIIGGEWEYKTSFSMAQKKKSVGTALDILFEMKPRKDPSFDFFLAKLDLDDDYTHFKVHNFEDDTDVELQIAGKITIAGLESASKKIPLDFSLSGIEFTGMRLANFAPEKKSEQSTAASKKFSYTFDPICEGKEHGDIWFNLGTWSLASPGKQLGPFDFTLENFAIKTNTKDGKTLTGVNIVGSVGLLGQTFVATAGVTVWAELNISDIKNIKVKYAETTLDEIGVHSEFGGCVVEGSLKFEDTNKKKGYAGTLEFTLPGELFTMKAAGGFFKCTDSKGKFMSAYFEAEVGSASGIPMPPIQLNSISGGFYFNTSLSNTDGNNPLKWKKTEQRDVHGGMFGLGISTIGSDRGVNAKVKMIVVYDAAKNRLSTFRMNGEVHALCVAPQADDGLINADCSIVYQNLPKAEGGKFIQINITVDAAGDMDQMVEAFTGQKIEIPDITAGLEEMEDKSTKKNKDAKETKAKVSCGVHLALDFKVTMRADDEPKGTKTKWHLWLGQPGDGSYESEQKNRCSITLIDFQAGGKDDAVAVWGKIWANAYLCIGNELPNNGHLPPIPKEIDEFLNGKDASGGKQALSGKASAERDKAVKDFDGAAKSGVMFGAQAGGDFGVNALICYARATLIAGFDIVLKQLEPGTMCNNKPAGGKGGFYGTGQVYALAKGELGLIFDLWIFKGKIPLIDVGLGALLKGGFPNPSWAYGKVRAKCSLLGGLIKFNGSLTFDIGDVCYPDAGNPLDDIKIFGDMTPGEHEWSQGWPKGSDGAVSCYSTLGFTTNMKIGARLDLVDVNMANRMAGRDGDPEEYYGNCHRAYVFHLDPKAKLYNFGTTAPSNNSTYGKSAIEYNYVSSNQEDFKLIISGGKLQPLSYYMMVMKGYAKEIVNGHEQDPIFNDASTNYKNVSRPWTDADTVYFHTASLPNNLNQDVALKFPSTPYYNAYYGQAPRYYKNELAHPELHLNGSRVQQGDDIFDPVKYEIRARIEKYENGIWVPADAKIRAKTTSGFYVDENGDVDYTTKLNDDGTVANSQRDPFSDTHYVKYGNSTNGYDAQKAVFRAKGLGQERLYRYINKLEEILKGTKSAFRGRRGGYYSSADKYQTLKWIPETYTSLEIAIDYYKALLGEDKKSFSSLSGAITELNNLKTEIYKTYNPNDKGGNLRSPLAHEDADIEFLDCPTTRGSGSSYKSYIKPIDDAYNAALTLVDSGLVKGNTYKYPVHLNADEAAKVADDVRAYHKKAFDEFFNVIENVYCTESSNSMKKKILAIKVLSHEADSLADAVKQLKQLRFDVGGEKISVLGLIADAREYSGPQHTMQQYYKEMVADSARAHKKYVESLELYSHHDYAKDIALDMQAICDSINAYHKWMDNQVKEEALKAAAEEGRKAWEAAKKYCDTGVFTQLTVPGSSGNSRPSSSSSNTVARPSSGSSNTVARPTSRTSSRTRPSSTVPGPYLGDLYSSANGDDDQTRYNRLTGYKELAEKAYKKAYGYSSTSRYTQEAKGYRDSIMNLIINDGSLVLLRMKDYEKKAASSAESAKELARKVLDAVDKYRLSTTNDRNSKNDVYLSLSHCYSYVDAALNVCYDATKELGNYIKMKTDYAADELSRLSDDIRKDVELAKQVQSGIASCEKYAQQAQSYYDEVNKIVVALDNIWSVIINSYRNSSPIIKALQSEQGLSSAEASKVVKSGTPIVICTKRSKTDANFILNSLIRSGASGKIQSDPSGLSLSYASTLLDGGYYLLAINGISKSSYKRNIVNMISKIQSVGKYKVFPDAISKIETGKNYPVNVFYDLSRVKAVEANDVLTSLGAKVIIMEQNESLSASSSSSSSTTKKENSTLEETAVGERYDVLVTKWGTNKTSISSALRNYLKIDVKDKATIDLLLKQPLPAVLVSRVSSSQADEIIATFKKLGCTLTKSIYKGKATSMSSPDIPSSVSLPTSAPVYLATVPGVAEAYELTAELESETNLGVEAGPKARTKKGEDAKSTPEASANPSVPSTPAAPGVAGMPSSVAAGIISSVASGMNAKAAEAKPASSQPASVPVASMPLIPSAPAVPAIPSVPSEQMSEYTVYDNKYSSANQVLQTAYKNSGSNGYTASGYAAAAESISYYADAASVSNSKLVALPVTYHCGEKNGNYVKEVKVTRDGSPRYHWITIDNVDISDYVNDNVTQIRITIEQVDKVKLQNYLETLKKEETFRNNAILSDSTQYLANKGTAETDETINLEKYLANYYEEMKDEKLFTVTDTTEVNKIINKKESSKEQFVQQIYQWFITMENNNKDVGYDNFAAYAKAKLVNSSGGPNKSPSSYEDNEGFIPTKVNYKDESIADRNLWSLSDESVFGNTYYTLKNPNIWLAYVGGFAFYNSLNIYDETKYMNEDIYCPRSITLNYTPLAEFKDEYGNSRHAYRLKTSDDVRYSNGKSSYYSGAWLAYNTGCNVFTPEYRYHTKKYLQIARWWVAWTNDNRAYTADEKKMWTLADAMEEPLPVIKSIIKEIRYRWEWFNRSSTSKGDIATSLQNHVKREEHFSSPNYRYGADKNSYPHISTFVAPLYQAELVSIATHFWRKAWLSDYNDTFKRYGKATDKHTPEYRYSALPALIAGGFTDVSGNNFLFDFDAYCNNVKSIEYRAFRANCYDTKNQCFDMDLNKATGFYYDFTQYNPLNGVAEKYKLDKKVMEW